MNIPQETGNSLRLTVPIVQDFSLCLFHQGRGVAPASFREFRHIVHTWMSARFNDPLLSDMTAYLDDGKVQIESLDPADFQARYLPHLVACGMAAKDAASIGDAVEMLIMHCEDHLLFPLYGLWLIHSAALALSNHLDGVVVDMDKMRAVPNDYELPEQQLRAVPRVGSFLSFPCSQDQIGWLMNSFGMRRFGLPEIELSDAPDVEPDYLSAIMGGIAQSIVEVLITARINQFELGELSEDICVSDELNVSSTQVAMSCGSWLPAEIFRTGASAVVRLEIISSGLTQEVPPYLSVVPPREQDLSKDKWIEQLISTFFQGSI